MKSKCVKKNNDDKTLKKLTKKNNLRKVDFFHTFSARSAQLVGHPFSFFLAVILVIIWLISGPIFNYSDTWQLIINTATTVVTFLIVFLIQNTQNRDIISMQIKLDELIKCHTGAKNSLINLDHLTDKQIKQLEESYKKISNYNLED